MPEIPPGTWAKTVSIRIIGMNASGKPAPIFSAQANAFRVPHLQGKLASLLATALPVLVEDWMMPAGECGGLKPGKYILEIAWSGSAFVDKGMLDASGQLMAEPVPFEVKKSATAIERAEHLEHLAQYEFLRGNLPQARSLGEEALRLGQESFGPERADTYLMVAHAALAMNDKPAAVAAYRALLAELPPPSQNDMAVYVSEELAKLE
jgi:hypothetical protein